MGGNAGWRRTDLPDQAVFYFPIWHRRPASGLQTRAPLRSPAVLTAIIFQELFIRDGGAALTFSNHRMLAGILAVAVGLRTRRSLLVIAVGMAALWILNLAFPG